MKHRKLAGLGLLALVLVVTLISYTTRSVSQSANASPPEAETITSADQSRSVIRRTNLSLMAVDPQTKTVRVPVSGRVVPEHQTSLFAEVPGRLLSTSRPFKAGERFRAGNVLLQIDAREFALNLEAQKSAFLNILTGMMPDLKADYPASYPRWLAYVQGYDSGTSLPPLPEAQSDGEKYFATANEVYTTFYTIQAQEERLKKYTIRAPYAGIITATQADVGGLVSPGQSLGTLISTERYELEAGVNLGTAARLSVGDRLRFASNELEGTWTGEVIRVNDIIDPSTQNVPVFFRINGADLKMGMYLEGMLATQRYEDVFVIPQEALSRDESVLVLEDDVIVRKPIVPVEYLRDSVIVRGLAARDRLILNQFDRPVEGQKVSR